jgi:hypothetical protein
MKHADCRSKALFVAMSLGRPFVVRVRCGCRVVEVQVTERRPCFAALLCKFAELSGTPPPPPGYELAIRTDYKSDLCGYIGHKMAFSGDAKVLVIPSTRFTARFGLRGSALRGVEMVFSIRQPGPDATGPWREPECGSFMREGLSYFADHDLGELVYARSNCEWFGHRSAFIVPGCGHLRRCRGDGCAAEAASEADP